MGPELGAEAEQEVQAVFNAEARQKYCFQKDQISRCLASRQGGPLIDEMIPEVRFIMHCLPSIMHD